MKSVTTKHPDHFRVRSDFYQQNETVWWCEILENKADKPPKGWFFNPINNGMFIIYQLVIRISLAHP